MFSFLVSLINHEDEQHGDDELAGAGLSLAATAIEVGGDAFATHPQLLALLRQDLAKALTQVAESRSPAVLSAACGLMVTLYIRFRPLLRVQLELWLSYVLLPLAEGGSGFEQQRAALEAVGDLCRQPCFVTDLFVNVNIQQIKLKVPALLCVRIINRGHIMYWIVRNISGVYTTGMFTNRSYSTHRRGNMPDVFQY